jgi:hypothetical protein
MRKSGRKEGYKYSRQLKVYHGKGWGQGRSDLVGCKAASTALLLEYKVKPRRLPWFRAAQPCIRLANEVDGIQINSLLKNSVPRTPAPERKSHRGISLGIQSGRILIKQGTALFWRSEESSVLNAV